MALLVRDRQRIKLLEYLGNPENDYLTRSAMSTKVLGYKREEAIYRVFTPEEISAIEAEGLEIRRKKYASQIASVDNALMKRAREGDPQACKLVYQRFENWSESKNLNVDSKLRLVALDDVDAAED